MVIMKTAYKYYEYPSIEQKEILNRQMFLAKEIYNMLLEKSKAYYKETRKTLTEYRMNNWLMQIKKEKPEFTELHSQGLQDISKRISDACVHFFRRSREKKHGKKINAGFSRHKMPQSEGTVYCQECGISKGKDPGASINILKRATSGQREMPASGDIIRPSAMNADLVERGTIYGVSQ